MDNESLKLFAEKILAEKGVNELTLEPEVMEQMKNDLISRLEDRINAVALIAVPPDKLAEFEQLLDSNSLEKMQSFLALNVPNIQELIAQELLLFRETYLRS